MKRLSFVRAGEGMAKHNKRVANLVEAAREAADWLCDSRPGSDQWERGVKLKEAIIEMEKNERIVTQEVAKITRVPEKPYD